MSGAGESPPLKTCSNPKCPCENPQPLTAFHKMKAKKDGLRSECKVCACARRKRYYDENTEACREAALVAYHANPKKGKAKCQKWRTENPEAVKAYSQRYYEENAEALRQKSRDFYRDDPEAGRERAREYREANPDKVRETNSRSYWKNPDIYRGRSRDWRAKNPERARMTCRLYHHQNYYTKIRPFALLNSRRRRVRLYNAEGSHSNADVLAKLELQGGCCYYCHEPVVEYDVDHKIALANGGTDWPANIAIACPFCNGSKNAKDFWQFLAKHQGRPPF